MIRIYIAKKTFTSPFVDIESRTYLEQKGVSFTTNFLKADIILSVSSSLQTYVWLKKLFPWKKYIVWTNEPRYEKRFQNFIDGGSVIMNVFSGNVFFNNLHFLGSYHNNFSVDLGINLHAPPGKPLSSESLRRKKKFCVAVFAFRDPEKSIILYKGQNLDLFSKRQELAGFFQKFSNTDIIGSNWPSPYNIKESSGYESKSDLWWDRKLEILQEYKFNICFENTIFPFYCTEKIWHSIAAGCLPIYYGKGTAIYNTFPQQSFIDASMFSSNEELLSFLINLPEEEHLRRFNLCLEVMHEACKVRASDPNSRTEILEKFVDSIQDVISI